MRYFYSFLFYLILPGVFLRMLWRSRRMPGYRWRWLERLGFYSFGYKKCIWVHAVSVGETIAATPMILALQARYPQLPMLVTTMTPTGAQRVKQAFGETAKHAYIPYDLPDAAKRFINKMNPVVSIIVETELWPNMIHACYKKNVPVCLVNARLSAKSARGYHRIGSLAREMMQRLTLIAANGEPDAERFFALGASKNQLVITGNIKFDLTIPTDLSKTGSTLRESLGKDRFIWIAASTHEGEEEMILNVHKEIRAHHPHALLILVPRHPDRFESVAALCKQKFPTICRSQNQACTADTAVFLGDTMGEMLLYYSVADVAFVGGSLVPRGGHNILEPAAFSKPIITGTHIFNFAEIVSMFLAADAMKKITDTHELVGVLDSMIKNPKERLQMGQRALNLMNANRGALARQLAVLEKVLDAQVKSSV